MVTRVVSAPAAQSLTSHLATDANRVIELLPQAGVPIVSIAVATYNRRVLVLELVEALGALQGGSFEIIVVDDGSTDGTGEAVIAYATRLGLHGRVIVQAQNHGTATARALGVLHARADIIAFTDSDCLPDPEWLKYGLAPFAEATVGIVQGRTRAHPQQRQPFFSHFMEIDHFNGTFSTCNIFYRREALLTAGNFDPSIVYWEDLDMGWRVSRLGWRAVFAPDAIVNHQIIPLSAIAWFRWPEHLKYMPANVACYPEFRRYLFLGLWGRPINAMFDLAVLSLLLAVRVDRLFALGMLPYLVAFAHQRGLRGRWPPLKAFCYLAWDAYSLLVLVQSSVRHRSLVL